MTTEVREVVKEVPVEKIMVKEVVKEVPVEKVVVKEIDKVVVKEVPVEKVVPGETITIRKTEIKYVPVPMNDIDPLISSPPYLEGSDGQPATVARLSA